MENRKYTRDDALLLLKSKAEELGRLPKRADFAEAELVAIKAFLGPMPRALEAAGLKTDFSGNIVNEAGLKQDVRPGNIPIGVLERNEYTRDEDAYNGMMPGPILTDAMIEMPWFL